MAKKKESDLGTKDWAIIGGLGAVVLIGAYIMFRASPTSASPSSSGVSVSTTISGLGTGTTSGSASSSPLDILSGGSATGASLFGDLFSGLGMGL